MKLHLLSIVLLLVLLAACATPATQPETSEPTPTQAPEQPVLKQQAPTEQTQFMLPPGATACELPSRNVTYCKPVDEPVCGQSECKLEGCTQKTYPNACEACRIEGVSGYTAGACSACKPGEVEFQQPGDFQQAGIVLCIEAVTRADVETWKRCTTADECSTPERCGYALYDTSGRKIDWLNSENDKNGYPALSLRCLPSGYIDYLKTKGFTYVDKAGDSVFMSKPR